MNHRAGFARYLAAKRAIDDRSLNRPVWQTFLKQIQNSGLAPGHVLEVGCGRGTMLARVVEWELLGERPWHYHGLDSDAGLIDLARALAGRLVQQGAPVAAAFTVQEVGEALPVEANSQDGVLAHAFLDLVDQTAVVPRLLSCLKPGGSYYFTLNYDGQTCFWPPLADRALDDFIETRYHATMGARRDGERPTGGAESGRRLLSLLPTLGAAITAVGASDWVVTPLNGRYPNDDAFFLGFILDTVAAALRDDGEIPPNRLQHWYQVRRSQLADAELIYIAHQLDLTGLSALPGQA